MPISFPFPVRVAVGIVASGVDRLRHMPEALPALSVTIAGQAMRASMRVQQEIAELAIRGDEVLGVLGGGPAEHPTWAKFDDEPATSSTGSGDRPDDGEPEAPTDLAPDPAEQDGDGSVVDLPTRSARRGAGTGPSHTRPARSSAARGRGGRQDSTDGAPVEVDAGAPEGAAAELAALADAIAEETAEQIADEIADEIEAEIEAEIADEITADEIAEIISEAVILEAVPDVPDRDGGSTLPGYDTLSLAELRGHLRRLSADQVAELVDREAQGANRAPFLTLLTNRLTTLEHGAP